MANNTSQSEHVEAVAAAAANNLRNNNDYMLTH